MAAEVSPSRNFKGKPSWANARDQSQRTGDWSLSMPGPEAYSETMPHPVMFEDDDPLLVRVRAIALAFPGAAEKVSHGRPAFYTTKIFAYYGGAVKQDGAWVQHGQSAILLLDQAEREALLAQDRVYVPGYLGVNGWIGVNLTASGEDWQEIAELMEMSYRNTAGKRLIADL